MDSHLKNISYTEWIKGKARADFCSETMKTRKQTNKKKRSIKDQNQDKVKSKYCI